MGRTIIRNNKKPKPKTLPIVFRQSADDERLLQAAAHSELAKYRMGTAGEGAWNTIVCRINIGMTLARWHFNEDVVTLCRKGLDAMVSVRSRFVEKNQWGMSGDEFGRVSSALIFTDDMQLQVTRRQLAEAITHVYKVGAIYK